MRMCTCMRAREHMHTITCAFLWPGQGVLHALSPHLACMLCPCQAEEAGYAYYRRMLRTSIVGASDEEEEDVLLRKMGRHGPSAREQVGSACTCACAWPRRMVHTRSAGARCRQMVCAHGPSAREQLTVG